MNMVLPRFAGVVVLRKHHEISMASVRPVRCGFAELAPSSVLLVVEPVTVGISHNRAFCEGRDIRRRLCKLWNISEFCVLTRASEMMVR